MYSSVLLGFKSMTKCAIRDAGQFGSTIASVESCWLGYAMTWRFGGNSRNCISCKH